MVSRGKNLDRECTEFKIDCYMEYHYKPEPGVPGPGSPQWLFVRELLIGVVLRELDRLNVTIAPPLPSREDWYRSFEADELPRHVVTAGLRDMLLDIAGTAWLAEMS